MRTIELINKREGYRMAVQVADDVDTAADFEATADGTTFLVVRDAWEIAAPETVAPAAAIELEIDASTQYAIAYRDGKTVATVQRRRVYTKGPYWRAFDLNGAELFNTVSNVSARYLAKRIEAALQRKAEAAQAPQIDEWHNGNIPAEIGENGAWIDVMSVSSDGGFDVALCVPARGMNPNGADIFPGWAWRLTAYTYDRATGRIH